MKFDKELQEFIIAGGILIFSLIIGIIFKKYLVHRIRKLTQKTHWEGDDIILEGLNKAAIPIFLVSGIYIAIQILPLELKIISVLNTISIVIILLTVTILLGRIAAGFITNYTTKNSELIPATSLFSNITKIVIFVIGVLVILQFLGISIAPILAVMGVGGLAVGLALQDTLSNLFSGLNIIASKQIKPGDYIKLDNNEEGLVTDITWRYTTIKAMPNNRILVPNFKLASAIITNYNLPELDLSVPVAVTVSYESDLDFVEKITLEVAKQVSNQTSGAYIDFEPVIRYNAFAPSGISFNVVLRAHEYSAQFELKHHFIKELHQRYKQEGIVIPYQTLSIEYRK